MTRPTACQAWPQDVQQVLLRRRLSTNRGSFKRDESRRCPRFYTEPSEYVLNVFNIRVFEFKI